MSPVQSTRIFNLESNRAIYLSNQDKLTAHIITMSRFHLLANLPLPFSRSLVGIEIEKTVHHFSSTQNLYLLYHNLSRSKWCWLIYLIRMLTSFYHRLENIIIIIQLATPILISNQDEENYNFYLTSKTANIYKLSSKNGVWCGLSPKQKEWTLGSKWFRKRKHIIRVAWKVHEYQIICLMCV